MRRVTLTLLTVVLAFLGVVGLGAGPALAHSAISATFPGDGEPLEQAPEEISIVFNQPNVTVGPDSIRLVTGSGDTISLPAARVENIGETSQATVTGLPALEDGWYAVTWSAISPDGHGISGTFTFTVGDPAGFSEGQAVDAPADPAEPYQRAAHLLRGLTYISTLLAVGLLFGLWALSSRTHPMPDKVIARVRRWSAISACTGLVLIPLLLLNNAVIVNGGSFDGVTLTAKLLLQSSSGAALLIRMSALFGLCTAVLLLMEKSTRKVGAALVAISGVVLFWTFAINGHASVVESSTITSLSVALHLIAAATWLGGVPAVAAALWSRQEVRLAAAAEAVDRFSKLATVSVFLVFTGGALAAWAMFEEPSEVLTTEYGIFLLMKVALVSLIALMGAYNHFVLVPRMRKAAGIGKEKETAHSDSSTSTPVEETAQLIDLAAPEHSSGDETAGLVEGGPATSEPADKDRSWRDQLRSTVLAESVGLVLVVVATAGLTSTAAPAAAGSHAQHLGLHSHGTGASSLLGAGLADSLSGLTPKYETVPFGQGELELSYYPAPSSGEARYTVVVYDRKGRVVELDSVKVTATLESPPVGPLERELARESDESWSMTTRDLSLPGQWTLRIDVAFPDGSLDFTEVALEIDAPQSATDESLQGGEQP